MSSQNRAIVDKLLTNASNAYIPSGFISELIFPFIPVVQTTGKLAKYGTNHLRLVNSVKAGRGKYRQIETIVRSSQTYEIEGHGLEGMVTEDDYRNVEAPYDAERDEVMGLSTVLWLEKENLLASTLDNTAIITQYTTLAGQNQYNDYVNSNPLGDFSVARSAVFDGCGAEPNAAWMSWKVWDKLRYNPSILNSLGYKYNRKGALSKDELATAMGVEKIFIANPKYDSSKEGQTAVFSDVWGKNIWFGVLPDKAAPYQISAGYRLGYKGDQPRKVYKQANFNPPNSTAILCEDNYEFLISNALAVYEIKAAVA